MRPFEKAEVGHVRNYAYGELVQKLESCGMTISKVVQWGFPFYSPIYRNLLERTGTKGAIGQYGASRKLVAQVLYYLFWLNSSTRGDELVVLAESKS